MYKTAALLALLLAAPSFAQNEGAPGNFVAGGVASVPDSPGADSYRLIPFAAGRATLGGVVFQIEGPGLSASLYNEGAIEAGAYVRYYGGRDDDTGDAIVDLLPEADSGIVGGGFIRYMVGQGLFNEFDRVYFSGRVGTDLTGEYGGAFWSASAAYATPLSRTTLFIANLSISGSPDDYADRLFSIDGAGSAASGLPVYMAESGIQDIGVTLFLDQQITDTWSVTGIFGASRLQGDYAESPIVRLRGDDMQYFAGVGIGRRF
jgi:outer membrane protein